MQIAVVEDDRQSREKLQAYLQQYAQAHALVFDVSEFADGAAIADGYRPLYDVIFLDIEMPHLDGMRTAQLIRELDEHVILVFVTNVARYAVKGYEVQALDYILKPLNYESFSAKMDRIVKTAKRREEKTVILGTAEGMKRIPVSHILYAEVLRHQVVYHTEEGNLTVRASLKEAEGLLEGCGFEKCNSGFLVNLRHVRGVADDFALVGSDRLPVSRAKKKAFMQALAAYIGSM